LKERLHRWTRGGQYGFLFDNAEDTLSFSHFLLARHKARLQGLVAVARKLIHAIYGVLRSKTPYDGRKLFPALPVGKEEKVQSEFSV
jgi:hypothetical protein